MENNGDRDRVEPPLERVGMGGHPSKCHSQLRLKEEKDTGENEKTEGKAPLRQESSICKGPEVGKALIVKFKGNHYT